MSAPLHCLELGRRAYRPTWRLQNELADRLRQEQAGAIETLVLVEHDPVITIGRRGRQGDVLVSSATLASRGIELVEVDRGGEVTYHGPGQLVVYPIVRVDPRRFGVGDLVRGLAAAIARVLAEMGIDATYDTESPGLWVKGAKICAVGMRVSRGVSTHGAAVNVTTDLTAFELIVPCGQPRARATSVAQLTDGPVPTLRAVGRRVAEHFAERFDYRLESSP